MVQPRRRPLWGCAAPRLAQPPEPPVRVSRTAERRSQTLVLTLAAALAGLRPKESLADATKRWGRQSSVRRPEAHAAASFRFPTSRQPHLPPARWRPAVARRPAAAWRATWLLRASRLAVRPASPLRMPARRRLLAHKRARRRDCCRRRCRQHDHRQHGPWQHGCRCWYRCRSRPLWHWQVSRHAAHRRPLCARACTTARGDSTRADHRRRQPTRR